MVCGCAASFILLTFESMESYNGETTRFKKCKTENTFLKSAGGDDIQDNYTPEWFLFEFLFKPPTKDVFRRALRPFVISFNSRVQLVEESKRERDLLFSMYDQKLTLPNSLIRDSNDTIEILAAHNGFLLLGGKVEMPKRPKPVPVRDESFFVKSYHAEFYTCNAMTKQWFALPLHDFFKRANVGFITRAESGVLTSYKVVIVRCAIRAQNTLEFEVFSSETKRWVDLKVECDPPVLVSVFKKPVLQNNTLFWNFRSNDGSTGFFEEGRGGILAYNPDDYKLQIIGFPPNLSEQSRLDSLGKEACTFGVSEGRIKC
ncbi:OLC1v1012896C1 [Oldenlandia corymbosa var. corymbosa]|uniref:OLC1v1012896C1 n=1 Tax=Oldenlandia corymbosa var. corymbosa TaxID=529605 RepID=A0AAV1DXP4_OLDCO|nr:OLC1v1012896C1 [Oldenlandia corymbosa var. corymbosa]